MPVTSPLTAPGSGTVYTFGPTSTFGDLRVDNDGAPAAELTILPGLGSGIAQNGSSGATLVTDRGTNIPAYFEGHWVEIANVAGDVKGTWRIATINNKTVTLAPNAGETIAIAPDDQWVGLYRFDTFLVAFQPGAGWHYFPSIQEMFISIGLIATELALYVAIVCRFPIIGGRSIEETA